VSCLRNHEGPGQGPALDSLSLATFVFKIGSEQPLDPRLTPTASTKASIAHRRTRASCPRNRFHPRP
jgi:hypothetical protein